MKAKCPFCGAEGWKQPSQAYPLTLRYQFDCNTWGLQFNYGDYKPSFKPTAECLESARKQREAKTQVKEQANGN